MLDYLLDKIRSKQIQSLNNYLLYANFLFTFKIDFQFGKIVGFLQCKI